ncbi:MAG: TatD family hydrolase [Bacteroidaceae bacterium]|nr:TatD family hydrolase [Bacteroidaceae bacterium]
MDFHTHNLQAAMPAIINMPQEWLMHPERVQLRHDATYSVGVHPWWTNEEIDDERYLQNLKSWANHPQVVAIGECGIDKLKGAYIDHQIKVFKHHIHLSETVHKPLTIHCVRAFDIILQLKKEINPTQTWVIHGFRGKPALAQQLLDAGINLSFGKQYNEQSFNLCPNDRKFRETD